MHTHTNTLKKNQWKTVTLRLCLTLIMREIDVIFNSSSLNICVYLPTYVTISRLPKHSTLLYIESVYIYVYCIVYNAGKWKCFILRNRKQRFLRSSLCLSHTNESFLRIVVFTSTIRTGGYHRIPANNTLQMSGTGWQRANVYTSILCLMIILFLWIKRRWNKCFQWSDLFAFGLCGFRFVAPEKCQQHSWKVGEKCF